MGGSLTPGEWHTLRLPLEEPSGVNKLKEKINQAYMMLKAKETGDISGLAADAISGWGLLEVKVRLELLESHRMDKVDVRAALLEKEQDDEDRRTRGANAQ